MAKTKQLPYKHEKQHLLNSIQSLKQSLVKHSSKPIITDWITQQIQFKEQQLNKHYGA